MRRHVIMAAALSLLGAGPAAASYEFSLSSYTALALASSPEVRSAEDDYNAAEALYQAAWANMTLPTASLSATAYPWGDNPQNAYQFNSWRLNRSDLSLNTTLNLNVFNSFQDLQKVRAADASRRVALRAFDAARQDRAFSAIQDFYDLDSKNDLLGVARENLEAQRKQYEQSLDLYRHGMKSEADLLKSETDWRSSQLRLVSAEADEQTSLVAFNSLIGRSPLNSVSLRTDLEPGTTALPDIGADLTRAIERRPEVARAKQSLQAGRIAYQQALQGLLPTLRLDATWNHAETADFGSVVSASSLGIPNPNYYVGLSLSLPLGFNGVSQVLAVARARSQLKAAKQALEAAQRSARQDVAQAYINFGAAVQGWGLARLKADIAKRTLDLVSEQYREGAADAIRMSQAQSDFLDAQVSLAQARHDIFIERARYTRAVGDRLW
ncbi:MAG: TolC family protein [Elusimicrobia bacterium]|nr:TolC family protein [Elusimicrobiota bacterium]